MFAACVASVQTYCTAVQKNAKFASIPSIPEKLARDGENMHAMRASLISGSLRRAVLAKTYASRRRRPSAL